MQRLRAFVWSLFLVATILAPRAVGASPAAAGPDFNRDVRPILSDNCYACHGPDAQARKAGLRLDAKDGALQPLKNGDRAIVPRDLAHSALVTRITTADEDDVMPPPKSGKKLSAEQIEKLKAWIAAGADWPEHWAYVKPQRPALPAVKDEHWPRNEIDRFVLSRLEQEGLKPAPEADPATLIRRASLDLTGLPPTVEEVDQFLTDKSPDAYDKLVDRLLASPRYGENAARYWLDAVRYADSHGYHIDAQRDIWAYRDWVIKAFKENKPFDQFTIEQLAGDLLPKATTGQKIATGYIRCNMSTGEGGAIEAEYAAKYAFDRLETTGTTWMGLTLMCARCHTHKYDPILQREYYGLYAFFNQLDEPVMDGNRPNPDPFIKLPSPQQTDRLAWLKEQIAQAQARVEGPEVKLDESQQVWAGEWNRRLAAGWTNLTPASARSTLTNGAALQIEADQSVLAAGANPETDVYELAFKAPPGQLAGLRLEALPHDLLPHQSSARAEDGRYQLSEFEAELVPPGADAQPQKLSFTFALADAHAGDLEAGRAVDGKADTGWSVGTNATTAPHQALFALGEPVTIAPGAELRVRLKFEADKAHRALGHFRVAVAQGEDLVRALQPPRFEPWQVIGPFQTDGLAAGLAKPYEPETKLDFDRAYPGVREEIRWSARGDLADGGTHLLVNELHGVHGAYYLFRRIHAQVATHLEIALRADDVFKVWLNDKLVLEHAQSEEYPGVRTRFGVELEPGENRLLVKMVNYQGAKYFSFNPIIGNGDTPPARVAAILSATAEPDGDWRAEVRDAYRRQQSPEFRKLFNELATWREEQAAIDTAIPTTLVAKQVSQPRDTFLLMRGDYDKPGDQVQPGVPAILPPLPAGAPTNRLGLAEWLVSPEHPLTARVIVNRFWQQHFGVGLVKTTEDFGVQGERPSHPELLDWLATEFQRSGWDMKHMHRLIVTSATYRQSSRATPAQFAHDPENRLLARGPRFRLDAEVLRDTALYLGGLLVEKVGGPSVKPYQPPGLWEAVSFNNSQKYVPDKGMAQYRRSLYMYWKRQSPPPSMLLFDAPTREYCIVRRPRTNTPLQALAFLNDRPIVEAARGLAQRILTEGGPDAEHRLAYGFRLATARPPTAEETRILLGVLNAQLTEYRASPEAANKLLGVGDFKAREGLDPAELAAWSTLASLLLNLDETMTNG